MRITNDLTENDYYKSSDLPLVTTISLFHPIESMDRTDPRRVLFIFRRDKGFDELIEAFWRRELKVEPLAYFNQLKTIKSRLYGDV